MRENLRHRTAVSILLLLLLPSLALAQNSPEDQARGLLEDGRTYRKDGKLKQALDNFQTIVSGFPNTSFVDDALLEIGRYYLEVDRDVAKARDAFEQVTKRFPQSDGAPGAYYYLGRLTMERAMDEARAGRGNPAFSSVLKYYGAELNKRRHELLMQAGGSDALEWESERSREGFAARAWLRTKGNSIEGGTSEVQLNVIAKRILNLPGA